MTIRTQRTRQSRRLLILTLAAGAIALVGAVLVMRFVTAGSTSVSPGATSSEQATPGSTPGPGRAVHGALHATTPPPAGLPDSHVDPDVARKIALEYDKGRFNAFFDDKVFLARSLADGKLSVKALKDQLLSTEELRALPADVLVLTAKPAAVVERMAMIDTLEALGEADPTAYDALVEIGSKPFDSNLAVQVKRAVAAEKYDVFVALARKNWDLAKQTFLDLHNPALMDLLKPALIGGLVDSGLSRAQAVSTVETLMMPAAPRDG